MRRKASATLAVGTALALLSGGIAYADNVVNDVVVGGNDTITAGGTTVIGYKIDATGGGNDGQQGCNAADTTPATVSLTIPSGVTATGSTLSAQKTLTFTNCTESQYVTFGSASQGTYTVGGSVADAGVGTYRYQAAWTLKVSQPATSNQATLNVVAPATGVYGSSATLSSTGGSGSGAVTYEGSGTACTVSGAQLNITAGTGSCSVRAHKAASTGYNAATSAWADVTANRKAVTGSFTAGNKEYDGDDAATVTGRSVTGAISGDAVSLSGGTATFADKNAANGKTVTLTGAELAGAAAGNYSLTSVGTTTANITTKAVTGSFTAGNKEYDGDDAATVTGRSVTGAISGDAVSLSGGTATFADKNAANGKTVTLTGAELAGAAAGNYSLTSVGTTTASITTKAVTGSFTAGNKEYDGDDAATVTGRSVTGAISGDAVSLSGGTATFADKNAANGKTVTLTGAELAGAAAGNYSLTSVGTTTANITTKAVTGSFTAADKLYDGSKTATITGSTLSGVLAGDTASLNDSAATATFADALVGTNKTVTSTGFALTGRDAANYSLTMNTTTANIGAWTFKGFYQPVDMSNVVNTVKAGATVPLKFEVFKGATELTETANIQQPLMAKAVACSGGTTDDVELTTTGSTALRYDTSAGQFVYNWQTPKQVGTCYTVTVKSLDGSSATALFKTK